MSSVQPAAPVTADLVTTQASPPSTAGHAAAAPTGAAQATTAAQPAAAEPTPTMTQAQEALAYLQSHAGTVAPNLQFSIDHDTGRTVIKVIDAATKEVIRQIPPDEILRLDKALDKLQGLLLHRQA